MISRGKFGLLLLADGNVQIHTRENSKIKLPECVCIPVSFFERFSRCRKAAACVYPIFIHLSAIKTKFKKLPGAESIHKDDHIFLFIYFRRKKSKINSIMKGTICGNSPLCDRKFLFPPYVRQQTIKNAFARRFPFMPSVAVASNLYEGASPSPNQEHMCPTPLAPSAPPIKTEAVE